jgi:hypothetical protein
LGLDLISAGLPQPETSNLKDVVEQFRVDVGDLEALVNLSPEKRERESEQFMRDVEKLQRSINDAVVSLEEALLERARGLESLRRPNEGGIPDSAIGRVNVEEFHALADALKNISQTVKDPKLQQQIEDLLKRQEFFLRSGGAPSAPFFGEGGEPQAGGRVMPLSRGPTSVFGGGSGDDVLLGGAGSDTLALPLQQLAGKAEVAALAFDKLNRQGKQFEALAGSLAGGLADTNILFGSQAERLQAMGALLPDIGRQLIDVFTSGTVGAEKLDGAVQAVGNSFLDAFEGAISRGESLSDVFKGLALDLANLALNEVKTNGLDGIFSILGPLFGGGASASSATSLLWTAKGGAFNMGARLDKFAKGNAFTNSIVNRPTLFPMANGAGLMGESGPEAVLPLTRLANGDLGVSMPAGAGGAAPSGPNITYNIDARGADREGLRQLTAEIRQQRADLNWLNRSIEGRAVSAINYRRSRGPW